MRFSDRRHAGELLGEELARLAPPDPVVYGLPRGGMPVAFEVALELECPLDVLVVRKVGVPFQPELAMGAIAEGELVVRNEEVIRVAGISSAEFDEVVAEERVVLDSRVAAYRTVAPAIAPTGHTAIVVDDGLATGSTALAAVRVLRLQDPAAVWLAVPVAPASDHRDLGRAADRIVVLSQPHYFSAVGAWYRDFTQVTDEEVRTLLSRSRLA